MPRIVEQLQTDALDANVAVATLLRKVKLAAVKLQLGGVAGWVQSELAGYDGEVPGYRVVVGRPQAHNPFRGWIPISGNPEFMRKISRSPLRQSIPEMESLISSGNGSLYLPYPHELVHLLNSEMDFGGFADMGLSFDRSALVGICDAVRNAVLDWALDLERAGIMGSELGFSQYEQQRAAGVSISIGNFNGNFNSGGASSAAHITQSFEDNSDRSTRPDFSFDELLEAIERGVRDRRDREALVSAAGDMRNSQGHPSFISHYQNFVSLAADHMTILAPFIGPLSLLLGTRGAT